jgi:hypothetical protein
MAYFVVDVLEYAEKQASTAEIFFACFLLVRRLAYRLVLTLYYLLLRCLAGKLIMILN